MNKYHSFSLAVVALAAIFVSCTKTQKADETSSAVHEAAQWFAAGSDPSGYLMSTSSESAHGGKMGGFIRSLDPDEKGFGTYMQMIKADAYRGKQVKMTGWIKVDSVSSWAGMWCRVDGENGHMYDFDNMETTKRAIKAPTDWKQYDIIVNVPDLAKGIAYGFLIDRRGSMHFDDVKLEIVGPCDSTKLRKDYSKDYFKDEPGNLDFEK